MRKSALLLLGASLALAQRPLASGVGQTSGAAVRDGRLYVWGEQLTSWNLASGARRVIARSASGFGEGGCVDEDGTVYLQDGRESGPLIAFAAGGQRTEWDRSVAMHDCVAATLFGRSGVLMTAHFGQVRFYEGPRQYREVYSFYTPSRQAGLLIASVDSDPFPDMFCGNYWIRSPREFALPWRLFAINTRSETPDSATMTLTSIGRRLFAAQGHMKPGNLLSYTPGPDPAKLWTEQVIAADLRFPHALAGGGFGLVVGENDGPGSRLFVRRDDGDKLEQIGTTNGIHSAFVIGDRVLTVGRGSIDWWTVARQ